MDNETVKLVKSTANEFSIHHPFGHSSTRDIRRKSGISHSTVHKIMREKLLLYPYHLQVLHSIPDTCFAKRVAFADFILNDPGIVSNILWSDEAYFSLDGVINRHNCVIWGKETPTAFATQAFTANFRLEPFFFPGTVNAENYLNMLQSHVRPGLTAKRKLSSTIFMQDGAPPHIGNKVKQYLFATFTEQRIISRHFICQWPP